MTLGISRSRAASNGAFVSRGAFHHWPDELTVTVTSLFNRIAVQVDDAGIVGEWQRLEGEVDATSTRGTAHVGTVFLKRYDADEYYANLFNLREDTGFSLNVTLRLIDDATGRTLATFRERFATTTLSSETPQLPGGRTIYIDPVSGSNSNDGLTVGAPKQWLDSVSWAAGDTIVLLNGDFGAATTAQRRLLARKGTADNWIRVTCHEAAGETARIWSPIALNGPWTAATIANGEAADYPNTWVMSTTALIGVVRDETTGYELQPHQHLTNPGVPGKPGLLQGNVDGHASWFCDTAADKLYIRTEDGVEPPNGRFVSGLASGLNLTGCSYVVLDGLKFGPCQNITTAAVPDVGTVVGLDIRSLDQTGNRETDMIIVRNCDIQNTQVSVLEPANTTVRRILFDNTNIERHGIYETIYQRFAYTEADPYASDYGYDITKSSLWDKSGLILTTTGEVVFRGGRIRGFHGINPAESESIEYCKHLDIYNATFDRHLNVSVNLTAFPVGPKGINAAVWNCTMNHGAEPITLSPINAGPVWIFCVSGDGVLHTPFKLGIQGPTSPYDTDDGNAFKVLANNSLAMAGHTNSETIGNLRLQGGFSGVLADNNVLKVYQHTDESPTGYWFSYMTANSNIDVKPGRVNVWHGCLIYTQATVADPQKPKQRWGNNTYDVIANDLPPSDEIVWEDCLIGWSANPSPGQADIDPFPVSVAAGLSPLVTRKSVGVRGITCLAAANPDDLPIGAFTLREP